MHYPVVIHKDTNSDYGVTVPDLPGCFSAGQSVAESLDNTLEAIACHLQGLRMDGEAVPALSAISTHQQNPDFADGIWTFIEVVL
ncbi:MAG: type II toxin-antitoxin system HicB family antitoxin [Cyanobacteria bacterium J06597_16]